jgi:hypothetical protein
VTETCYPGVCLPMRYQLKVDELVWLGSEAIHMVGMMKKRRELAKLGAEEVVVEAVVAAAEVRAGGEKYS